MLVAISESSELSEMSSQITLKQETFVYNVPRFSIGIPSAPFWGPWTGGQGLAWPCKPQGLGVGVPPSCPSPSHPGAEIEASTC